MMLTSLLKTWRRFHAGAKLKDVLAREVHFSDEVTTVEVENLISPVTIASLSTFMTEVGEDVFLCRNAYLHRQHRFLPLSRLDGDADFDDIEDAPWEAPASSSSSSSVRLHLLEPATLSLLWWETTHQLCPEQIVAHPTLCSCVMRDSPDPMHLFVAGSDGSDGDDRGNTPFVGPSGAESNSIGVAVSKHMRL
jgi:hypothetical protein